MDNDNVPLVIVALFVHLQLHYWRRVHCFPCCEVVSVAACRNDGERDSRTLFFMFARQQGLLRLLTNLKRDPIATSIVSESLRQLVESRRPQRVARFLPVQDVGWAGRWDRSVVGIYGSVENRKAS